ncbi:hypothetical protein [Candidatus Methanoliparum sp. LAM-1]|uniref:hypothetical protein n=1 Tax=Candidatus Methanoliparum sp. LAM-1 TaxID=2874846 RepID=UPI001E2E288B|nr:hypothetical protein [Candidatus Methanoliparum sp. LAM-1]BDC35995.1 hypothetical protein MTLP_06770 [Candidatus Methanoliparum sp. LAM-1]
MKRSKNKLVGLLFVATLLFMLFSPSILASEQEEKVGVLLIGFGEPERYDADAYVGWKNFIHNYMEAGMKMMEMPYMATTAEKLLDMMDSGTLLVDRDDPFASKPKDDPNLIDAWGNSYEGEDYKWVSRSFVSIFGSIPMIGEMMPQHPYYLAPDGPGKGESDFWEYMGLDMYGLYQKMDNYNPGGGREQRIMDEVESMLKERYGDKIIIGRGFGAARPGFPDFRVAAEKLVKEEGVKDLVLAEAYVCFSEFEHPAGEIPEYLKEKGLDVNIITTRQIGGTDAYNKGVANKVEEELKKIQNDKDVVVILNHHGMPCSGIWGDEPYHEYAKEAFDGAKNEIYNLDIVKNWRGKIVVWQVYAEMADGMMDPDNEILSIKEAADKAVKEGYEYCIDVPYEVGNSGYETLIGLREAWGLEPPAWEEYYEDGLIKYRTEFEYDGMDVVITDGWIDGYAEGYYKQISMAIDKIYAGSNL